ncbi:MAG: hypothetical protein IPI81_01825 [Flavobacteriales bacterium]|nr:hypothetical protein [Flavobacteriales bacterium]MCC6938359.1 hypothetical protein [Flavobacteriales bacterium]
MLPSPTPIAQPLRKRDPALRSYPFPYKAWLTISSDPDNTLIGDWEQLHALIWKELGLPFADSLFIRSYNEILPDQVDLHRYPQILDAHPHDTIHTWGDFMFAGARAFHRPDAEAHAAILLDRGFVPRVWVDHSMFPGNLMHRHQYGGIPAFKDLSGHSYPNPLYSLDIIHRSGVRYIWDGAVTNVLGQDRPQSLWAEHRERAGSFTKAQKNILLHRFGAAFGLGAGFRAQFIGNDACRALRFPDGTALYVFPRYGEPHLADIHGMGELLSAEKLDLLTQRGGTTIIYTHLGKRRPDAMKDAQHIPPHTQTALRDLARRFSEGEIMLSSISRMLDYLILRDHITIDREQRTINFNADGIAFESIGANELSGHAFSISGLGSEGSQYRVVGTHGPLQPTVEAHYGEHFTLRFA